MVLLGWLMMARTVQGREGRWDNRGEGGRKESCQWNAVQAHQIPMCEKQNFSDGRKEGLSPPLPLTPGPR